MSLMTENKARELLAEYMDAELSGDNDYAAELEEKIKKGGWKITVGPEGTTVIRDGGGWFSSDTNTNPLYPKESYVTPYTGTQKNTGNNTLLIVGISIGALALTIIIIAIVKAVKARKS